MSGRTPRRDSGAIVQPSNTPAARPATPAVAPLRPVMPADPRAERVLKQLRQLQQSLAAPRTPAPIFSSTPGRLRLPAAPDTEGDARVGQLNSMLEKVIRIQHPEEGRLKVLPGIVTDDIGPADSGVNTIAAVVATDQTLASGNTIGLRITDSIKVNGRVWPAGQLVYGIVTVNNDRMLVHVNALREDRSLYVTDWQVYDLDGIAGIHIPGVLSRDVVKESAEQGVSSLNVLEADPSLGAQAAGAGIQTVKTFLGRKVKQVRVSVRAGYQLLLRSAHPKRVSEGVGGAGVATAVPPDTVVEGPVIAHCRAEDVRLRLRGIWLYEEHLWFGLEWENGGAIAYVPAYARWYIRDRRRIRRTAMQELPLETVGGSAPITVTPDSVVHSWSGFAPFALSRDKELVLEVAEKGGGRVLELVIKSQELLKAKNYVRETRDISETTGDRPL